MHPSIGAGSAVGTFPPWRDRLNISLVQYSQALLRKITWAGGNCSSYENAASALSHLANLDIDSRQVERYTNDIGHELDSYQHRNREEESLVEDSPSIASVISVDPGKVQVRAEGHPPGVHNRQWKNTNVAHLQVMVAESADKDPKSDLPQHFQDERHVGALVTQLGRIAGKKEPDEKIDVSAEEKKIPGKKDQVLMKSCLATMADTKEFAANIRNEAQRLGMEKYQKKVFLADGGKGNWNIHETFFPHWTPILDFIHLIEHLFTVAVAAETKPRQAWSLYLELASLAWKGNPTQMVDILEKRQQRLGEFHKDVPQNDPRRIIHNTIHYIKDNSNKMDYPAMRRQGLPISSCRVESLIKQINRRVKASDKFWIVPNLEAVLQIRAAEISTTKRWDNFWEWKMAA